MYIFFCQQTPHKCGCNQVIASFVKQSTTLKTGFHLMSVLVISLSSCQATTMDVYSLIHSHESLAEFDNLFLKL